MAKFCGNCGKELLETEKICLACGTNSETSNVNSGKKLIAPKNIVTCVILTIVTCGIYGIYWFITMTDNSNQLSDSPCASGGLAFLYTLLTCGIYGIYWAYKMGNKMYEAGKKHGKEITNNSLVYLLLAIFGFGIVNFCLIQADINKFAE